MKIEFLACADICVIDARTNQVSLINLCEELQAEQFPAAHPQLALLSLFVREQDEPQKVHAQLTVKLNGIVLAETKLQIDFQNLLRCRNTAIFSSIPLMSPGELRFEIKLGRQSMTWTTHVGLVGPPKMLAPVRNSGVGTESSVKTRRRPVKKRLRKRLQSRPNRD